MWRTRDDAAPPLDEDLLRAKDVVKSPGWGGVNGAILTVRRGETMILTGPAGSGKSGLLHCLSGVVAPDSGEVWYDGSPLHAMSEAARARVRRESIGLLFPRTPLVSHLTAEENVALPLLFSGRDQQKAWRATWYCLELLDLADCGRLRPGEMATAKVRRLALARALVRQPQLLLADEPTLGLDPRESAHLLRVLTTAIHTLGGTLVVAARDPGLVGTVDRHVTVVDGQIVGEAVLV